MLRLENVGKLMQQMFRQVEDMWIEHTALHELLTREYGFSNEFLCEIESKAKKDHAMRKRAAEAFASWRKFARTAAVDAVLEDINHA